MSKKNKHFHHEKDEAQNVVNEQEKTQSSEQETTLQDAAEVETTHEEDELKKQIAELEDKNLRMMAEFDNYRRRTNKEKLDLITTAGEKIFKDILPIMDDFERAIEAMNKSADVEALREGVLLIYQKFKTFLEKNEVKEIATSDAVFDTDKHEAITTFPVDDEEKKGKIIECTQKGYTLGDKVIRYAKVVIGD